MKKTINILVVVIISILLKSCGVDSITIQGTNFILSKEEKARRLDSIRIVKVIDDRPSSGYVIGHYPAGMNNRNVPVIIDKQLDNYLKNSFNSLIVKDTTQKSYIPVTVYINQFETAVGGDFWGFYDYHKYSYLFEYPNKSNHIEKLQIIDSLTIGGHSLAEKLQKLTKDGIRSAARNFIDSYNYKNDNLSIPNIESNTKSSISGNDTKSIQIDSIDFTKSRKFDSKSGGYFGCYRGNNVDNGFRVMYLKIVRKDSSKFEIGTGIGFTFFKVKPSKDINSGTFYAIHSPIMFRYNFSDNANGFFIGGCLSIEGGTESIGYGNNQDLQFFFGPTVEESVGIYLFKAVSLTFGTYQLAHFGSKVLPYDLGLVFSIGITGIY